MVTEELPKTCRVSCQNKFGKLVHLVGFIIKKFCTFLYLCLYALKVREYQQLSQGSRSGNRLLLGGRNLAVTALPEDVGGGNVQVGKITFNTHQILGNGCEGTFVFK